MLVCTFCKGPCHVPQKPHYVESAFDKHINPCMLCRMLHSTACLVQDDPDQYVDDASRAEACTHSPADPLASTPSVPSQAKALPALCSLSSASGRRRILTADEVAHRRQHQKALLEAVTLLTACLKHLQASDTPPPLQTQPDYQEPASAKLAKRNVTFRQESSSCQMASDHTHAVLIILQALSDQQQLKAHVMTACQLIDPSMGYAGTTAANAGRRWLSRKP